MLEKLGVEKGHIDFEDIDLEGVIQEAMNARRETVHMANAWLTTVSNMFDWATQGAHGGPGDGQTVPILTATPASSSNA